MTAVIKKPLIVTSACVINLLLFLFAYLMVTKAPQSITGLDDINLINFIRIERPPAAPEKQPDRIKSQEPPPTEKVPPDKVPPVPKLEAQTPPPAQIKMDLPAPDIGLSSSIQSVPYIGEAQKTPPAQPVTEISASSETLPIPEIITEMQELPDNGDELISPPAQPVAVMSDSSEALSIPESTSEIQVVHDTSDELNSPPAQPVADVSDSSETLPIPEIITEIPGVPNTGDDLKSPPAQPVTDVSGSSEAASMPKIITNITPKVRIEPQYPARALRAGIEGIVTVEFTIAVDGSLKDIKIVGADPPKIFDYEVLKVLKRWKFSPQTVDGKTVETRARQDIRFQLHK